MPSFPRNHTEKCYMANEHIDEKVRCCSSYFKVSRQVSSPENISLEPYSHRSIKISVDDLELNSSSSPASSLCHEPEAKVGVQCNIMLEEELEQVEDEDEDEVMSSYVIEINSDHREGTGEAVSIDEAIAWAKEKFRSRSFDKQHENVSMDRHSDEAEGEEIS